MSGRACSDNLFNVPDCAQRFQGRLIDVGCADEPVECLPLPVGEHCDRSILVFAGVGKNGEGAFNGLLGEGVKGLAGKSRLLRSLHSEDQLAGVVGGYIERLEEHIAAGLLNPRTVSAERKHLAILNVGVASRAACGGINPDVGLLQSVWVRNGPVGVLKNEGSEIDMIGLCIAFEPDIRFVLFDIEMPDNYSLEMLSSIKCKSSA